MAQARRKRQAKANPKRGAGRSAISALLPMFKRGLGLFSAGALAGVLAVLLWQGYQSEDQADLGSGLKEMIEASRIRAEKRAANAVPPEPVLIDKAPRLKPQYDFYTVLPEIEEVLPKDAESIAAAASNGAPEKVKQSAPVLKPGSAYMLQVASYGQEVDAQRLKAKLALGGLRASIQKVSIERKNYYRVRIGPYTDYGSMTSDDYKLSKMGFKAMRLRISRAG